MKVLGSGRDDRPAISAPPPVFKPFPPEKLISGWVTLMFVNLGSETSLAGPAGKGLKM